MFSAEAGLEGGGRVSSPLAETMKPPSSARATETRNWTRACIMRHHGASTTAAQFSGAAALKPQRLGLFHARYLADLVQQAVRRRAVDFDQRDRRSALLVAAKREGRDVDARFAEQAGETADEAGLVLIGDIDHRRREFGVDFDVLDRQDARFAVMKHGSRDGPV